MIAFSWISNGDVDSQWAGCMMDALRATPDIFGDRIQANSGANVSKSRNTIAERFLDESDNEWLWMVDTDILFAPDAVAGLLESADAKKRPIVSGLYFAQEAAPEAVIPSLRPLIFQFDENTIFESVKKYQQNTMFEVAAAPTGMLLVHRSVLEKTRNGKQFPWFYEQVIEGKDGSERWVSEDLTFSLVCRAAGFPIFINTAISCAHRKQYLLTEEMYIAFGGPVKLAEEST